ncbi:MAG TPA: hypothetical protein VLH36_13885 [Steroidobacteraceae bacterium]|nr:hypothetical protein [Steroidobacteraceae bacterium]
MSHTCQRCGEAKGADDMVVRGGKPSKTCKACFSASFQKKSGGGKAVKAKKADPAPKPVKLDHLSLEIARGYGFRASAENEQLVIEQDDDQGQTATVVFSRTEAKVLFAQFAEWSQS